MNDVIRLLLLFGFMLLCYVLGSLNTAVIFSRTALKDDVRSHGSGNAGMTNMLRVGGAKAGAITFAGDCLKGVVAALLGRYLVYGLLFKEVCEAGTFFGDSGLCRLLGPLSLAYICGISCIIGHIFPLFFGLRGGKGVSTTFAVAMVVDWRAALLALSVFIVIFLFTRYVSLGSIIAAASLPVFTWFFSRYLNAEVDSVLSAVAVTVLSALLAFILIAKHKANIGRLLRGEEKKLQLGKK